MKSNSAKFSSKATKHTEHEVKKSCEHTIEAYSNRLTQLESVEQQAKIALNQADLQLESLNAQLEKLELVNEELLKDKHQQLGFIESLQHQVERLEQKCKSTDMCQSRSDAFNGPIQIVNTKGVPISTSSYKNI